MVMGNFETVMESGGGGVAMSLVTLDWAEGSVGKGASDPGTGIFFFSFFLFSPFFFVEGGGGLVQCSKKRKRFSLRRRMSVYSLYSVQNSCT